MMMTKRVGWLGMVVCTVAAVSAAYGQSGQPSQSRQSSQAVADISEQVGDLDFPGGTLKEYLEAVDKSFGKFNRVVAPEASSFRIEPVKFTAVKFSDVILILRTMGDRQTGARLGLHKEQGTEIWSFGATGPQVMIQPVPPIDLRVWSLRGLIDGGARVEDILSATEISIGLIGGEPKVRYHKDTTLLIIQGWPAHLDAANQVIGGIREAQHERDRAVKNAAQKEESNKGD